MANTLHLILLLLLWGVAIVKSSFLDALNPQALVTKATGLIQEALSQEKPLESMPQVLSSPEGHTIDRLQYQNPLEATNFTSVDRSIDGLPRIRVNHRVVDLFNGWHFDDILLDAPDSIRPSALLVFYNSSDAKCMKEYNALHLDKIAEEQLPARSQLFVSRYDMFSAPHRTWFEFTPEMDLEKRFDVKSCPEVVFVSRSCDGYLEYCSRGQDEADERLEILGCDQFQEQCPEEKRVVWKKEADGDMTKWVQYRMEQDGKPKLSTKFESFAEQGRWLQKREATTGVTHLRNNYISKTFPAFSERGFKAMDIPQELYQWLLDFVETHEGDRKTESWHAEGTQLSFHESATTFIDTDLVRSKKEEMANKYLKPLIEEWAGIGPLTLTSFYGVREYHDKIWLRQHVDRIDTHVISVTLSLAKKNFDSDSDGSFEYKPWPLQVTDWTGRQVAYEHPPGTMVLYESSKLPHGRPLRNQGGIHLGCFVHFKPAIMSNEWDELAAKAKKVQAEHTQYSVYKSTREVEQKEGEFEWAADGDQDKSIWGNKGKKMSKVKNNAMSATFANTALSAVDVYWMSPNGELVLQESLKPGSQVSFNTFLGHKFFWAKTGEKKALQTFEIIEGRTYYPFTGGLFQRGEL